jgi:integration host factor subunit beta
LVDIYPFSLYYADLIDIQEDKMNKADLVNALKNQNGFTRQQSEKIVDIFFDTMTEALSKGERVEIRGFGSIFVKDYKSYTGRNPKTGEPVVVKPKKLPFFRCGKELKERVDQV